MLVIYSCYMSREFDISRLLVFTSKDKYAATVAASEVIDLGEQIELPKKLQRLKPAVRAIYILDNDIAKWDFIEEEERQALREELGLVDETKEAEKNLEESENTETKEEVDKKEKVVDNIS